MTRDAEEFSVGGREYTVPRNDLSSKPKGWIREGSKIGPVLDADTNCHQGKPGIDLTEKSRIPDEEENDSARMGQPGSQELRIEPRSRKETDRPSAKAKLEPSLRSIQQSSLEQIQIPKGDGLMLNQICTSTLLSVITFRRECFDMNKIFLEKKTEQLNLGD